MYRKTLAPQATHTNLYTNNKLIRLFIIERITRSIDLGGREAVGGVFVTDLATTQIDGQIPRVSKQQSSSAVCVFLPHLWVEYAPSDCVCRYAPIWRKTPRFRAD